MTEFKRRVKVPTNIRAGNITYTVKEVELEEMIRIGYDNRAVVHVSPGDGLILVTKDVREDVKIKYIIMELINTLMQEIGEKKNKKITFLLTTFIIDLIDSFYVDELLKEIAKKKGTDDPMIH